MTNTSNSLIADAGKILIMNEKPFLRLNLSADASKATWYEPFIAGWLLVSDRQAKLLESTYQQQQEVPNDGLKH